MKPQVPPPPPSPPNRGMRSASYDEHLLHDMAGLGFGNAFTHHGDPFKDNPHHQEPTQDKKAGKKPATAAQADLLETLIQFTLIREPSPAKQALTWAYVRRTLEPFDAADLSRLVKKDAEKGNTIDKQFTHDKMTDNKKAQIRALTNDLNHYQGSLGYEWVVKSVRLQFDKSTKVTVSMYVIMKKQRAKVALQGQPRPVVGQRPARMPDVSDLRPQQARLLDAEAAKLRAQGVAQQQSAAAAATASHSALAAQAALLMQQQERQQQQQQQQVLQQQAEERRRQQAWLQVKEHQQRQQQQREQRQQEEQQRQRFAAFEPQPRAFEHPEIFSRAAEGAAASSSRQHDRAHDSKPRRQSFVDIQEITPEPSSASDSATQSDSDYDRMTDETPRTVYSSSHEGGSRYSTHKKRSARHSDHGHELREHRRPSPSRRGSRASYSFSDHHERHSPSPPRRHASTRHQRKRENVVVHQDKQPRRRNSHFGEGGSSKRYNENVRHGDKRRGSRSQYREGSSSYSDFD